MYDQSAPPQLNSWLESIEKSKMFDIGKIFTVVRAKEPVSWTEEIAAQSEINRDISNLGNTEKERLKSYLADKVRQIDSNFLSKFGKLINGSTIPSWTYVIFGSIIGYCLIEVIELPLLVTALTLLGLFGCLSIVLLKNSQNRFVYNYLLDLLEKSC